MTSKNRSAKTVFRKWFLRTAFREALLLIEKVIAKNVFQKTVFGNEFS